MNWSSFSRGVFLVNLLGIVWNPKTKKVLIGKREKDPHIPALTWCFPGGRPRYGKSLEKELAHQIQLKTGIRVRVGNVFFARTHPEKKEFLSIYFHCTPIGGKLKAGELFVDAKWVSPRDVKKHFTTNMHPIVWKDMQQLGKKK